MTDNTVLVPITLQIKNSDVTFVTKDGVSQGRGEYLGKVTTIMHKTVQTFEDTVEIEQPAELLQKSLARESRSTGRRFPLPPASIVSTSRSRMSTTPTTSVFMAARLKSPSIAMKSSPLRA